jgi:glutamate N-acetyltransferase/amino-acid N-acetyltransferase
VCAPSGFKAAGAAAGLRASGPKADLALVVADAPAAAAGVFTKNLVCAAPVTFCREALAASETATALLINAGQANAATGDPGRADCDVCAAAVAAAVGCDVSQVLLASTGVIGRRIKVEPLVAGVPPLAASLGSAPADAHRAAVAITTTDLVSKSAALEVRGEWRRKRGVGGEGEDRGRARKRGGVIDTPPPSPPFFQVTLAGGATVRVGGFAKGSGMIHPNMATMLAVVTTDAAVAPAAWRPLLAAAVDASFNAITVDGDTSTNDTVIGLASGAAEGAALITDVDSAAGKDLAAAVTALLQGLAKAVAWDGEGATCLIEVTVTGAPTPADARTVAKSVAASSLVKAAVFGHDPNWGRIACAAGYAGVPFAQTDLDIDLGPVALMRGGQPLAFDAGAASAYLKEKCAAHATVEINLRVGAGPGAGAAGGCDMSYDYVRINAEYTT